MEMLSTLLSPLAEDGFNADDFRLDLFLDTWLERGACADRHSDAFELDAYGIEAEELPPTINADQVDDVAAEISTNAWLATAYQQSGALALAEECARAAFNSWRQYHDVLPGSLKAEVLPIAATLNVPGAAVLLNN